MAVTIAVRLRTRDGVVADDVTHMAPRAANGLVSRGRAVFVDNVEPVDDVDEVLTPGVSPVNDLLRAVRNGALDADDVVAAELERDAPRKTILQRLDTA